MATHRKSIVKETIDRLEEKMAIGESRYAAKQEIRKDQGKAWSVSDGRSHSFKTRSTYQEHSIRFVKWARETHHVTNFEQLDPRAGELVSEYLQKHIEEKKSPYTLQAERSALRMLFNDRSLAKDVKLPVRARSGISRSRGAAAHDKHFQPENWQPLMKFLRSTGLRRQELRDLRVRDIYQGHDGNVYVQSRMAKVGGHGKYRRCQVIMKMSGRCARAVRTMQKCLSGFRATWMSIPFAVNLHKPFISIMLVVETYLRYLDA